jgi:hypothetical protein
MKSFLIYIFLFFSISSFAQFEEHFTDGGFNTNPNWDGTENLFQVNTTTVARELYLKGSNSGGVAYLSTPDNSSASNEWKFYIRLGFNPSNLDFVKVYLTSSVQDLQTPLNGYFIKIGRIGNSDGLEFYRQDGTNEVLLLNMLPSQLASSPNINVRVIRDNTGKWVFYWKNLNAIQYAKIDSIQENTHRDGTHFGFLCNYTNATKDSFAFDDLFSVLLPNVVVDTIAPKVESIQVKNNKEIVVLFNEDMDTNSIKSILNYSLAGFGNPINATVDPNNSRLIHLQFSPAFTSNTSYNLTVTNVSDIVGNNIQVNLYNFSTFYFAQANDVIINEIMITPLPLLGLPNAQYIELRNKSSETIFLTDWKLSGNNISKGKIAPNELVILCAAADTNALKPFGNTVGLANWATIATTDAIQLVSESDVLVDSISFDKSWYKDASKENGGYSLEYYEDGQSGDCARELFWSASDATIGGTPNSTNKSITPKNTHAVATLVNASTIEIDFEGNMDKTEVVKIANYAIDNGASIQNIVILDAAIKKVRVTLNPALQPNIIYHFIIKQMQGCVGVLQQNDTFEYAITDIPVASELILNEILFRPNSNGEQFVEIFNKTDKLFKIKDIALAQADIISGNELQVMNLTNTKGYIFPNSYLVFTKDKNKLVLQHSNTVLPNCVDVNLPIFSNEEDIVVLKNSNNEVIDKLHYYEDWHYPLLETTEGVSLEKAGPDFATQVQRYWHSAAKEVGFATPGFLNSEDNYVLEGGVQIIPEIFSPDGDGVDDETKITYSFKEDGNVVNVYLYNSDGRLINKLIENQPIQKEGVFIWNGYTSKGNKTEIGIHFLVFEKTNPQGKKTTYRLRCGVAAVLN